MMAPSMIAASPLDGDVEGCSGSVTELPQPVLILRHPVAQASEGEDEDDEKDTAGCGGAVKIHHGEGGQTVF